MQPIKTTIQLYSPQAVATLHQYHQAITMPTLAPKRTTSTGRWSWQCVYLCGHKTKEWHATTYFLVIGSRNGLQITLEPTDASTSFIDVTVIVTFLTKSHPVVGGNIGRIDILAFLLQITNLCFKIYNDTTCRSIYLLNEQQTDEARQRTLYICMN